MAFSLNDAAGGLVDRMITDAGELGIGVTRGSGGETLVDCGAGVPGGIEAGLRVAAVCTSGLAALAVLPSDAFPRWPWQVVVRTSQPVLACLASQYAGWSLRSDEGGKFRALGSGPARALALKEPIFDELPHRETSDRAVLVLEADRSPPASLLRKVADDCRVAPERLTVLFAPVRSLAGSVQVVARVVEVSLHKAHALKFPLDRIVDALGSAPLSPPHPDMVTGMGRTNDAIIFGGRVHLFVSGPPTDAAELARALPSAASRDYGAPFAEIFRRAGGDFYAIDPLLFSPAAVAVTALASGETFRAGAVAPDLLDASFR
jgi:methenyltetrahydromethanopterin cyclohydrolase